MLEVRARLKGDVTVQSEAEGIAMEWGEKKHE